MTIYDNKTRKICPDLNPTALQKPQTCPLKKLTEIEIYLLGEIEVHKRPAKKDEMIQYNCRHRRHRPDYINSDC